MLPIADGVDTGTVGVIATLLAGLVGAIVAIIKVGPERTNVIVTYQARALDDLQSENKRLIRENSELRERLTSVEQAARANEQKAQSCEREVHDLKRRIEMIESGITGTRQTDTT